MKHLPLIFYLIIQVHPAAQSRRPHSGHSPKAVRRVASRDRSASNSERNSSNEERKPSKHKDGVLARAMKSSETFPIKVQTDTYTAQFLLNNGHTRAEVRRGFTSFRALIHEDALLLAIEFLKSELGSRFVDLRRITGFMSRLIRKRAVYFYGTNDRALIVVPENGKLKAYNSMGIWESIGTPNEVKPFTQENCLTYDEIRFSALISFSGETIFLNDGNRQNNCYYESNRNSIEPRGIIIGAVGPCFETPGVMDYRDIFFPREKLKMTTVDRIFIGRYEQGNQPDCKIPLYIVDQKKWEKGGLRRSPKYTSNENFKRDGDSFVGHFNQCAYATRLAFVFDTMLVEANERARANDNFSAFIHVAGLGLGVWVLFAEQQDIYVKVFLDRLRALSARLTNVSDVRFADRGSKYSDIRTVAHINVVFSNEEPSARVENGLYHKRKLLIRTFPYDGNAIAGNEFWENGFTWSGDPAAACSSQIAETFNPHINPRVGARNLYVVTGAGDMFSLQNYLLRHIRN